MAVHLEGAEAKPNNHSLDDAVGDENEAAGELVGQLAAYKQDEESLARMEDVLQKRAHASLESRLQARKVLKNSPLFAGWQAKDVEAVVKQMATRNFPPNARIWTAGDEDADEFFIITKGSE